MEKRNNFSSRLGFVLAAAGSAVGLGNIWRFPYLAAKYGGGIFLLVYLVLVVTFGFTLMIAETALGRKTGLSAIGAFKKLDKRFGFLGVMVSVVPIIILPYYSVIGGWVMKYLGVYITGNHTSAATEGFFGSFISAPVEPLIWFLAFVLITFVIVLLGVEKGVEKVSKFLMPVLIILSVGIAVYALTLPGALDGLIYYIKPDFSKFSINLVLAALGQMFYSMSLAMGIMITYGSYLKKENNLEKSVRQIELFDTGVAFLAGLMIVPAVFVFSGGEGAAMNSGAGLMFETLPRVFDSMGMSTVVGAAFFIMVFFAALTSAISLMETVVSILIDKFKWRRLKACIVVLLIVLLLGVPSSLGYGLWESVKLLGFSFLDFFDFVSNSVLMPVVALFTCVFVAYFVGKKAIVEEVRLSSKFKAERLFTVMIKYVAPIFIVAILVSSVLNAFGVITL